MANTDSQPLTLRRILLVVVTGVGAGFLSGLFGVGGGLVIVPALMAVLRMDQRRASATSLAAIIVTAAVGSGTYALHGEVSWAGGALLVVGALAGSQIGVWLLRRLPAPTLPWILIGFALFVIVSQYLQVPTREGVVSLRPASCALLILVGVCAGILSGLVGVGGGSVIVPGMELAVGAGDLIARGTSLLVMIPTGIAGTVTNLRHRMVDLRVGLIVGASAAATERRRHPLQHLPADHHRLDDPEDAPESARPGLKDSTGSGRTSAITHTVSRARTQRTLMRDARMPSH